jgi:hypothetical protein
LEIQVEVDVWMPPPPHPSENTNHSFREIWRSSNDTSQSDNFRVPPVITLVASSVALLILQSINTDQCLYFNTGLLTVKVRQDRIT